MTAQLRLFGELDRPWIAALLELVASHLGQPWRVLLDRIEHAGLDVHPTRIATVVRAIRRVTGGKAQRVRVARAVRALVLGHPALSLDDRDARLAAAAARLGLPPSEIEALLWADLAMERPVTLPDGPLRIDTLIAHANLDRIQRAVRRARSLRLSIVGPAHELVRTVARYGLIAKIRRDGELTVLDITGPLALFHATTVYGRVLAQLVPLLAEQAQFELHLECELDGVARTLEVTPPLQLPTLRPSRAAPSPGERLARDLERAGHEIDRRPPPIAIDDELVFPELAIAGEPPLLVEMIGFATAEYLAYKLERYAAANAEVVLCVDVERCADLLEHPRVVPFVKRVAVEDVAGQHALTGNCPRGQSRAARPTRTTGADPMCQGSCRFV